MANLPETSTWETGIYQIEETDVVRGGSVNSGGISNKQSQQLGNRTKYLYDRLGRVAGIKLLTINADATIPSTDLYDQQVFLTLAATGKIATLEVDGLPDGAYFTLSVIADTSAIPPACVKIEVNGLTSILGGSYGVSFKNRIWLYVGELISFTKIGSVLYVTNLKGNHDEAGEVFYKPFASGYALEARGQLVAKANFPRLWQFANDNSLTIPDATWLGSSAKQGLFGIGGSGTTFRLPDLRGVFLRGLDNSRGLDIDRPFGGEGIYQEDAFKKHKHDLYYRWYNVRGANSSNNIGTVNQIYPNSPGGAENNKTGNTTEVGGIETRPKNIAYTVYIRY